MIKVSIQQLSNITEKHLQPLEIIDKAKPYHFCHLRRQSIMNQSLYYDGRQPNKTIGGCVVMVVGEVVKADLSMTAKEKCVLSHCACAGG